MVLLKISFDLFDLSLDASITSETAKLLCLVCLPGVS